MDMKKSFLIIGALILSTLVFTNMKVAFVNKGISIISLSTIKVAMADDEGGGGGGGLCDTFMNEYFSSYGSCDFFDHVEWCEGTEAIACNTEKWQSRRCPPGDWELVCYEYEIKQCNL